MQVHSIVEQVAKEVSAAQPEPMIKLEEIVLNPNQADQKVKISTSLPDATRSSVTQVLMYYKVVFA